MSTPDLPTHYRYVVEDVISDFGLGPKFNLAILELEAIRETPCGYWIERYPGSAAWGRPVRWVSKNSGKRFAYPTKAEALANYIRRTGRHIAWEQYKLEKAQAGLKMAEDLKTAEDNRVAAEIGI